MTRMRQGRKVARTLYEQQGPTPADTDPIIGLVDTAELAAEIVAAVNARTRAAADELAAETQDHDAWEQGASTREGPRERG